MKKYSFIVLFFLLSNLLHAQIIISGKTFVNPIPQANSSIACDTVYSFPVHNTPTGLTHDEKGFWLSSGSDHLIYNYDFTGHLLNTIPSPTIGGLAGGDLDFDGQFLWVIVEQDGNIY